MKIVLLFTLIFLISVSAFAQNYEGKITKIIDGKTAIITLKDGGFQTILLQYLEVPEPEQQLSQTVKDHLETLVLSKSVRFVFEKNYSQGWIGTLYVGETNVNMQMLRDGAAWFDVPESNGFGSEYRSLETLAKNEKRGVWGVEGLKPAWEFRKEQQEKQIEARNLERKKNTEKAAANAPATVTWAKMPEVKQSENENSNGSSVFDPNGKLTVDYDIFTDKSFVSTPVIILPTTGTEKLFGVQYHSNGNKIVKGGNQFLIVIAGVDEDDEVIILSNDLSRINLGYGQRAAPKSEVFTYRIDRNSLIKIVNGKKALARIGASEAILDEDFVNAINRLLWATK